MRLVVDENRATYNAIELKRRKSVNFLLFYKTLLWVIKLWLLINSEYNRRVLSSDVRRYFNGITVNSQGIPGNLFYPPRTSKDSLIM